MEDRALYFLMYAVILTVSSIIVFFAMYRRQINEGVPINYNVLKAVFGISLVLWLGVAFSNLFYNRSTTNASVAAFCIGMIFSLFAAWQFNKFVQNVLNKLGTTSDEGAEIVVPTIEEAEKAGELILLAEDNSVNQVVISKQLNKLGYAVEVASDGQEALALMEKRSYGLLLTDIQMPNLDGLGLSSAVRIQEKETGHDRLPILAVTGKALKFDAEVYTEAGLDSVLTKPIELARLKENLDVHLHNQTKSVGHEKKEIIMESAVDIDVMKSIVGDDQETILTLFNLFKSSSPEIIAEIHQAFKDQTANQIEQLGHKLKTSSQSIGAVQFGALCTELEDAGSTDNWDKLNELHPQLDRKFADVVAYIESYQNL